MLFALAARAFSADDYCKAPFTQPEPLRDWSLQYYEIVIDHGLISPPISLLPKASTGKWLCDDQSEHKGNMRAAPSLQYRYYHQIIDEKLAEYPPNCRIGDLTLKGREQVQEMGKAVRNYLVDKCKYLPEEMDPDQFSFYSAPTDKSTKAAEAFLDGLYPPLSDNEVLKIELAGEDRSSLVLSPSCKDIADYINEFKGTESYKQYYNNFWTQFKNIQDEYKFDPTPDNAYKFCQWATSMECNEDATLPISVNGTVIDKCKEVIKYENLDMFASDPNKKGVGASAIMRQLFYYADLHIGQGSEKKFALHSTSTRSISAILALLDYTDNYVPMGSALAMELWENNNKQVSVRFVLNGQPIKVAGFTSELVPFNELRQAIMPLIDYCHEFDIF